MKLKSNIINNNIFFLFIIFISLITSNLSGIKIINSSDKDLQIRTKSKFITIPKHNFKNIHLHLLRDLQKDLLNCPIQNLQKIETSIHIQTIQNIQNTLPFKLVYKFQGYNKLKSRTIGPQKIIEFEKIEFSQANLVKYLKSLEPKPKFKHKFKNSTKAAKTDSEFLDNIFGEDSEEDDLEELEEAEGAEWYMREACIKEELKPKQAKIITEEATEEVLGEEIDKLSQSVIFLDDQPNIDLVDITEEFKQNSSSSKVNSFKNNRSEHIQKPIGSPPIFIEDSANNSKEHTQAQTSQEPNPETNKKSILKKTKTNNNYFKKTILAGLAITASYASYKYYNKYYKKQSIKY